MCPARSCLRVRGRSTCVATRVCLLHGRGAEGREGGGGDRVWDMKRSEDPGSLQVSTRVEDSKFIGYGTARCHSHGPSRPVPGRFVSVCAFACFSYRETWSESCESRSDMPPARPHGVTGPCCHFQAEVSPRAFLRGFSPSCHSLAVQLTTVTAQCSYRKYFCATCWFRHWFSLYKFHELVFFPLCLKN